MLVRELIYHLFEFIIVILLFFVENLKSKKKKLKKFIKKKLTPPFATLIFRTFNDSEQIYK